jgi:hypothetical protein
MKFGMIAASMGAFAVMGSLAYAQNATRADIESAIKQSAPIAQADQGPAFVATQRVWSAKALTPKGDSAPAGRVALLKPPARVAGSATSPDVTGWQSKSDNLSGALSSRTR